MIFNIPVGRGKADVAVYGAANETITITPSGKTSFTVNTDSSGYAGTQKLAYGSYTLKGGVSGYSKTVTVDKNTTKIGVFPDITYFWHGHAPLSAWTSSGYTASNRTNYGTPTIGSVVTVNYKGTLGITIAGTTDSIDLTNVKTVYFNVTTADSGNGLDVGVSSTKVVDDAAVKKTVTEPGLVSLDVSALSGKYYLFASALTSTGGGNRTLSFNRAYGQ